jgi:hypothetical protein
VKLLHTVPFFTALGNLTLRLLWAETILRPPIELFPQEERILEVQNLENFAFSSECALVKDITPSVGKGKSTTTLLIRGLSAGFGTLLTFDKKRDYRQSFPIKVLGIPLGGSEKTAPKNQQMTPGVKKDALLELLQNFEQTLFHFTTDPTTLTSQVVAFGTISDFQELQRLAFIQKLYPKRLEIKITTQPSLLQEKTTLIQNFLKTPLSDPLLMPLGEELKRLEVKTIGNYIHIAGALPLSSQVLQLENHLSAIFPFLKMEIATLNDATAEMHKDLTLHFQVYLLELSKGKLEDLGIHFTTGGPSLGIQVNSGFRISPFNILQNFDLKISLLEQQGKAKLLSQPKITLKVPGSAELFSGGKIPITTTTRLNKNVSWEKCGLSLKLDATFANTQFVRLSIQSETSFLEPGLNQQGYPGMHLNQMKTQVDAPMGQPLVLSGLIQNSDQQNTSNPTFFSQIPLLGPLFSSKNFQAHESEFVAVLVPSLDKLVLSHPEIPALQASTL